MIARKKNEIGSRNITHLATTGGFRGHRLTAVLAPLCFRRPSAIPTHSLVQNRAVRTCGPAYAALVAGVLLTSCISTSRHLVRSERGPELARTPVKRTGLVHVDFALAEGNLKAIVKRSCDQRVTFEETRSFEIERNPAAPFLLWAGASLTPAAVGGVCLLPVAGNQGVRAEATLCSPPVTTSVFGAAGAILLAGIIDQILAVDGSEIEQSIETEIQPERCALAGAVVRIGTVKGETGKDGTVAFTFDEITASETDVRAPDVIIGSDVSRPAELPNEVRLELARLESLRARTAVRRDALAREAAEQTQQEAAEQRLSALVETNRWKVNEACRSMGVEVPNSSVKFVRPGGAALHQAPDRTAAISRKLQPGDRLHLSCSTRGWAVSSVPSGFKSETRADHTSELDVIFVPLRNLEGPDQYGLRILEEARRQRALGNLELALAAITRFEETSADMSDSLVAQANVERQRIVQLEAEKRRREEARIAAALAREEARIRRTREAQEARIRRVCPALAGTGQLLELRGLSAGVIASFSASMVEGTIVRRSRPDHVLIGVLFEVKSKSSQVFDIDRTPLAVVDPTGIPHAAIEGQKVNHYPAWKDTDRYGNVQLQQSGGSDWALSDMRRGEIRRRFWLFEGPAHLTSGNWYLRINDATGDIGCVQLRNIERVAPYRRLEE